MVKLLDKDVTGKIIACTFKVHRTLGAGFLEKVYENALLLELRKCGSKVQQQIPIKVHYDGESVGEYFADLLVEDRIICEPKAADVLKKDHEIQLVNYLAATGLDTGLLINFGQSVTVKRKFRRYEKSAEACPVNPEKSC